jgi:type II restriction enzyme
MDIAASDNCRSIRDKYNLTYDGVGDFRVGFITATFYNEITSPQQRGMLRFFDFVYITRTGDWKEPVSNSSEIVSDLSTMYE